MNSINHQPLDAQFSHNTSSHYDDEQEHEHDESEHEHEDNNMHDDDELYNEKNFEEEHENPEYPEDYDDDDEEDHENDQETLNNTIKNSNSATEVDITKQLKLNKKISSKDFEALSILGKGGFGTVALVKKVSREHRLEYETDEGELYAMKIVKKVSVVLSSKDTDHTKAERNILQKSDHPFIVKLIYAFQNKASLYLVLEFVRGGELFMLLEKETTFDEEWSRFYLAEIALALGYLHEQNVIYRDLKPENVLLAQDGHIKLTDFGLCKENITSSDHALTFCGTIEYMAPEILKKRGHNKEVDWWSLGILMWDMMCCTPPFQGRDREETIKLIQRARPPFQMCYMSKIAKNLVYLLLQRDPTKRLGYGPASRSGDITAIKKHPFFKRINFEKLLARQITPPHIKKYGIDNRNTLENLTSNFDDKFISEPMPKSLYFKDYNFQSIPAEKVPESKYANVFDGFSFVHQGVLTSYHKYDDIKSELIEGMDQNDLAQQLAGQSYRQKDDFFVSQCAKSLGMSRRGSNPGAKGVSSGTNLLINENSNQLRMQPRPSNNLASGDQSTELACEPLQVFNNQSGLQLNNSSNVFNKSTNQSTNLPLGMNNLNLQNIKTNNVIGIPLINNMDINSDREIIQAANQKNDPFHVMSPNFLQPFNQTSNKIQILSSSPGNNNNNFNLNNLQLSPKLGASPSLNLNNHQPVMLKSKDGQINLNHLNLNS